MTRSTEGYVFEGEFTVYGVLDSIDYPGSSTFLRHQYPSQRGEDTQQRLADISKRVITQIGLKQLDLQHFHDPETGAINLLEINPRHLAMHTSVPPPRPTGPGDRLPPGGGALVGPLAQGCRERRDGGARAAHLDAGERAAVHRLR